MVKTGMIKVSEDTKKQLDELFSQEVTYDARIKTIIGFLPKSRLKLLFRLKGNMDGSNIK